MVGADRRKTLNYKKRKSAKFFKKIVGLISTILVLVFIGIYCIMKKKQKGMPLLLKPISHTRNIIPQKPKERWRYIKELENHNINIQTSSADITNDELNTKTKLIAPTRKILKNTNKNAWQPILQSNAIHYKASIQNTEYNKSEHQQPVVLPLKLTNNRAISIPLQYSIKPQTEVKKGSLKQIKKTGYKQKWILQCGSFRDIYQAETIRARFALDGIESHISRRDGWNRVMLNFYRSREGVDKMIAYLHNISSLTCITRTVRG